MLSALGHITIVLPTPSKTYCKKFEKIMIDFIKGEKKLTETDDTVKERSSIVSQIYISLLICKSSAIEIDLSHSMFLPLLGESRTTKK